MRWLLALILVGLPGVVIPVRAAEVVLSAPGTDGWRPREFPKIHRHTRYTVVHIDGVDAIKAEADCSASALYLPVDTIDIAATPRLQWRWKVESGLRIADERVKAGDDFAARVYVMFQFDPAHASLWERTQHAIAAKLYSETLPGNAIDYVWSSREPAGATWNNPFAAAAKMVSRGAGAWSQWQTAVVDLAADYQALFAHQPPPVLGVALMTDADNSCQQVTAYYADFRFLSR